MSASSVVVGIDVAKAHVDVSVLGGKLDAQRFDNQAEAHSALAAALKPLSVALVVMEATGSPEGFGIARRAVRPRGLLVMKSTYKGELQLNFSSLVVDEIQVLGSRCGPFEPALRLMESGRIDPTPLIMDQFPLEQALQAFDRAAQPGVLKVLLRPSA